MTLGANRRTAGHRAHDDAGTGAAAVPWQRQALSQLGEKWWSDPAVRFAWNIAARDVALSERWDDDDELVSDDTIAMSRDPDAGFR